MRTAGQASRLRARAYFIISRLDPGVGLTRPGKPTPDKFLHKKNLCIT
jgi:hypothetical protein